MGRQVLSSEWEYLSVKKKKFGIACAREQALDLGIS